MLLIGLIEVPWETIAKKNIKREREMEIKAIKRKLYATVNIFSVGYPEVFHKC